MGAFKSFEEILAWQKARELTKFIYIVSSSDKFDKDFSLKDQIRRSAVSVMANIAEGYDRRGDKEFVRFLNIAKGSLSEVKSHLFVAFDIGYVNNGKLESLFNLIDEIAKLISGLIKYLKSNLDTKNKKPTTSN
jgi:four helix bundle protein